MRRDLVAQGEEVTGLRREIHEGFAALDIRLAELNCSCLPGLPRQSTVTSSPPWRMGPVEDGRGGVSQLGIRHDTRKAPPTTESRWRCRPGRVGDEPLSEEHSVLVPTPAR